MFPNFLMVGGHRCGTTWVHENLMAHPAAYLPTDKKELHFFDRDSEFKKGLEHYSSFFEGVNTESAIGEVTPNYLFVEDVPHRIHQFFPDMRIIASLRNPIDMLYSYYWLKLGNPGTRHEMTFDFGDILAERYDMVEEGFYSDHLKRFLRLFDEKQVLMLLFDNLVESPEDFLRSICTFIGIDPAFDAPFLKAKINRTGFRRHTGRSAGLYLAWCALKKMKQLRLAHIVEKLNTIERAGMDPEIRLGLIEVFYKKNCELADLLGVDLDHWNK